MSVSSSGRDPALSPSIAAAVPPIIDTELAIVGGGLAGLPLALACAGAGIRTVVIERAPPAAVAAPEFDGRTTAIAFGSRQILAGIGVWAPLAADAEPILDIRVADRGSQLFLHYDHRAVGTDPLGWIVENRHLRRVFAAAAAALPSLTTLAPASVASVERGASHAEVVLADGRRIRARLVVAADGAKSSLREAAGIRSIGLPYRQHAIACIVAHERPHGGVAVEHFLPSGPFAILPMTGNRSAVVWSEKSALVPGFMALRDRDFEIELQRRFGDWLGPVRLSGERWSYPLRAMLSLRMTAPRLALVGEAAHVLHPIAGQGLNLGLRDAAALAELVVDACRLGLDPGSPALLGRYESWRRGDVLALLAATDGLNRLFSNAIAPLRLARSGGLALVERIPPVKRLLMRHAMGLVGRLPRLASGERL
jgi:2-octaprenyl-6-methoxyphenol hydroxylase